MAGELTEIYSGLLNFDWWWLFWALILIGVIAISIMQFRNRLTFKYPVRIFKVRENGGVKEINCKGGYIGRKNSASFFQIKVGKMPWQKVNLNTTPNPAMMDQDNRVYYKQIDLTTFVQMRRTFDKGSVSFAPVEQDVKYGAVLDIQKIKEALRTENPWTKIAPMASLILLFIFGVLGWWFVMNGKCPAGG